jgi:hypothetical protein
VKNTASLSVLGAVAVVGCLITPNDYALESSTSLGGQGGTASPGGSAGADNPSGGSSGGGISSTGGATSAGASNGGSPAAGSGQGGEDPGLGGAMSVGGLGGAGGSSSSCMPDISVCGETCPAGYYVAFGCKDGGTACECGGDPSSDCVDPCNEPTISICGGTCPPGYVPTPGSEMYSCDCGTCTSTRMQCQLQ